MEIAETKPFDVQIKLLMIGDNGTSCSILFAHSLTYYIAAVGKTCILMRFANDSFQSPCLSTIGIDYKVKIVNLDDKRVKLHVSILFHQECIRLKDSGNDFRFGILLDKSDFVPSQHRIFEVPRVFY